MHSSDRNRCWRALERFSVSPYYMYFLFDFTIREQFFIYVKSELIIGSWLRERSLRANSNIFFHFTKDGFCEHQKCVSLIRIYNSTGRSRLWEVFFLVRVHRFVHPTQSSFDQHTHESSRILHRTAEQVPLTWWLRLAEHNMLGERERERINKYQHRVIIQLSTQKKNVDLQGCEEWTLSRRVRK